jgi:hypothetical protein
MDLEKRIEYFSVLGSILQDTIDNKHNQFSERLNKLIESQKFNNSWFTPDNVRTAIGAIAHELNDKNLRKWTDAYPVLKEDFKPSRIGLIFAGNIPLAGFHDFLTVLISGNIVVARTSSKDPDLIPYLSEILITLDSEFDNLTEFVQGALTGFDAVIATGSNNSSRYFDYYFRKYPNIIRKNRNSIAILTGNETNDELEELGKDLFTYFGLGCRNVSKLFVPAGYDVKALPQYWKKFSTCIDHSGYANNYDYNKAIYLVNRQKFIDAGFLLLREETNVISPVSVLHYEHYNSSAEMELLTETLKDSLQCIVGTGHVQFGKSQMPHLWDYADGLDTLGFLLKKNLAGIL